MRWLVLAALLAGCQIDARSDDYRCGGPADCSDGRTCIEGWCVLGADPDGGIDGGIDGGVPDADPSCPPECTNCNGGACNIVCASYNSCPTILCPPGRPCNIECSADRACNGTIDCTQATSCAITCTYMRACDGVFTSGTGPFTLDCAANNTCASTIDCSASCQCDVTCGGTNACGDGSLITCPLEPEVTCVAGRGCSSTADPSCVTCP